MAQHEKPILAKAPLAYENPQFLNSPDGRSLRILAEYQEPLARFRRERIQDTVVFFGSARFATFLRRKTRCSSCKSRVRQFPLRKVSSRLLSTAPFMDARTPSN